MQKRECLTAIFGGIAVSLNEAGASFSRRAGRRASTGEDQ